MDFQSSFYILLTVNLIFWMIIEKYDQDGLLSVIKNGSKFWIFNFIFNLSITFFAPKTTMLIISQLENLGACTHDFESSRCYHITMTRRYLQEVHMPHPLIAIQYSTTNVEQFYCSRG